MASGRAIDPAGWRATDPSLEPAQGALRSASELAVDFERGLGPGGVEQTLQELDFEALGASGEITAWVEVFGGERLKGYGLGIVGRRLGEEHCRRYRASRSRVSLLFSNG